MHKLTVLEEMAGKCQRLEERHQEHLELIVRLSKDSITTSEAEEMRGQIAKLIAEVGTLRADLANVSRFPL